MFTRHYANAAPCGPSRASLHTGMYLQNHRSATNGTPLDARHTNWALEARQRGYDPVLFGYTDTSNDPRAFEANHPYMKTYEGPLPGIDPVVLMSFNPEAWADWLAEKGYEIPDPAWKLYMGKEGVEYEDGGYGPAPLNIPAEHHDTWFMVDQVLDYLKGRDEFFVHLSLLRPHPPWVAPAPYHEMYPHESLHDFIRAESLEAEASQHPFLAWYLRDPHFKMPTDPKKMVRLKASYYGLMSEVDANLGRLFDYLKAVDQWDDTLVIFTSDHGEQLGDHHLIGKLGYFDQSFHIPLMVKVPGSEPAQFDAFTENVDIMPTLMDWLGIEIPTQCDGRSLMPAIQSRHFPEDWRQEAHWEYDFRDVEAGESWEVEMGISQHQCSLNVIRDQHYKYVHFTNQPALLFDLKHDPEELVNLAADPEFAPVVLRYAQKLLSWRMNHDEHQLTHLKLTEKGVVGRKSPLY